MSLSLIVLLVHFYFKEAEAIDTLVVFELKEKCNLGDSNACLEVAFKIDGVLSEPEDISKNKAFKYYRKACSLDNPTACGIVGAYYQLGKVVEKNIFKSKEYYKKACALGNELFCN